MTYAEAMARYGSDKPDLRFGVELVELTDYFAGTEFRVFQAPYVGAVVMPGGAAQSRKQFDAWQEWARSRGARGLAYVTVGEDGSLRGRSRRTCPSSTSPGWPGRPARRPGTRCSSPPASRPRRGRCSARSGSRSAAAAG